MVPLRLHTDHIIPIVFQWFRCRLFPGMFIFRTARFLVGPVMSALTEHSMFTVGLKCLYSHIRKEPDFRGNNIMQKTELMFLAIDHAPEIFRRTYVAASTISWTFVFIWPRNVAIVEFCWHTIKLPYCTCYVGQ